MRPGYFGLALLTAHVLVDFVLAGERAEDGPASRPWIRHGLHGVSHGLAFWLLLGTPNAWPAALLIAGLHTLIDSFEPRFFSPGLRSLLIGQALHLAIAIAALWALFAFMPSGFSSIWLRAFGLIPLRLMLLAAGAIFSVYVGAEVVGGLVAPLRPQLPSRPDRTPAAPGDRSDHQDRGFPEGGRIIGMLERALIYLLVILGQTGGIGFLVAAKSIFRIGELRQRENRVEAEYILIGTLGSFLWGLLIAASVAYLLLRL
ncbi:MAG: hypothetical protein ACLFWD_02225 [Anaerolineales bacterium]